MLEKDRKRDKTAKILDFCRKLYNNDWVKNFKKVFLSLIMMMIVVSTPLLFLACSVSENLSTGVVAEGKGYEKEDELEGNNKPENKKPEKETLSDASDENTNKPSEENKPNQSIGGAEGAEGTEGSEEKEEDEEAEEDEVEEDEESGCGEEENKNGGNEQLDDDNQDEDDSSEDNFQNDSISSFSVRFVREDNSQPLKKEEKILIYFTPDKELSAYIDNLGYFTSYQVLLLDSSERNVSHLFTIYSENGLLEIIGNVLVPKGCGEDTLIFKTKDGLELEESIEINIVSPYSFGFKTEDNNENINYSFENKEIMLSNFSNSQKIIYFDVTLVDILNQNKKGDFRLIINAEKNYVDIADISLGNVFLEIKSIGVFSITILEENTGISETISIIITE